MTDSLSPDARAVLDAVTEICPAPADEIAAAALRAAADHIDDASDGLECQDILRQIADELDPPSS